MIETQMILDGIELPYPPSVNHYWKSGRDRFGRPMRYLSTAAKDFKNIVKALCFRKKPTPCRVGIRVFVWPPDRRTRDLDNLLKGLLDSITVDKTTGYGVIIDDCQIDEIHMMRKSVHKGGKVQVWLWAIDCDTMSKNQQVTT